MGKISKLRLRWNISQGISRKELEILGGGPKAAPETDTERDSLEEKKKPAARGDSAKILHLQD